MSNPNPNLLERQYELLQSEIMHILYDAWRQNNRSEEIVAVIKKAWRTENTLTDYRRLKYEALPFMSQEEMNQCDAMEQKRLGFVIRF